MTTALIVTACGGSNDDGGTASAGPIKIGVATSVTGHSASLVGMTAPVAEAWAKYANELGGIGGHEVEIVIGDTKADPAAGLTVARQLVQRDKVSAVIVADSTAEAPVLEYLEKSGVPVLGLSYAPGAVGKLSNLYAATTAAETYVPAVVTAAKSHGVKKLGNVYCAESPICAGVSDVYSAASEKLGIEYDSGPKVTSSAPDYTAECLQLIDMKVDEIQLDLSPVPGSRVAEACIRQGYAGVFGTTTASFNQDSMSKVKGVTFIGPINSFPWWIDHPGVKAFNDAMSKHAGKTVTRTPVATSTWVQLELLRKALDGTDVADVSPAGVKKALSGVKDETLGGLLPQPLTFTENGPQPKINCFWMAEYTAGDASPKLLPAQGESGNGETGELASTCL
ncbi:ABC transporter substrate-binding protein [Micromonospora olivasterospora]